MKSLSTTTSDSGHGGQTKDTDGDEADGYDEVIYPVSSIFYVTRKLGSLISFQMDYEAKGHIVDDVCFV